MHLTWHSSLCWSEKKREKNLIYGQDTVSKSYFVLNSILKQTKKCLCYCTFLTCLKMNALMCLLWLKTEGQIFPKTIVKLLFPAEKRRANYVILCCYSVKISMAFNSQFLSNRFIVWFMIYWTFVAEKFRIHILKIFSEDYFYYGYAIWLHFLGWFNLNLVRILKEKSN